jgi:membrane associated rhomboid family serine protease
VIPLRDANPTHRRPVVTIGLIAACLVVFGYELIVLASAGQAGLDGVFRAHGLVAAVLTGRIADAGSPAGLAILTSLFLHGDPFHIGFNLLFLWIFGNNVEDRLGHVGFLLFYLGGGVVAAAAQVTVDPGSTVPVIGASGAIAAVLGAYLVLYPRARVWSLVPILFFIPLRLPAWFVLGLWFVLQWLYSAGYAVSGAGSVAYLAHVVGFLLGALVALPVRMRGPAPVYPPRPPRRRAPPPGYRW